MHEVQFTESVSARTEMLEFIGIFRVRDTRKIHFKELLVFLAVLRRMEDAVDVIEDVFGGGVMSDGIVDLSPNGFVEIWAAFGIKRAFCGIEVEGEISTSSILSSYC